MLNFSLLVSPKGIVPDFVTGIKNLFKEINVSQIKGAFHEANANIYGRLSAASHSIFQKCSEFDASYNISGRATQLASNPTTQFAAVAATAFSLGLVAGYMLFGRNNQKNALPRHDDEFLNKYNTAQYLTKMTALDTLNNVIHSSTKHPSNTIAAAILLQSQANRGKADSPNLSVTSLVFKPLPRDYGMSYTPIPKPLN